MKSNGEDNTMKNHTPGSKGFKSWYYYSLFGLLYFVQGSALAYFRNFQKPYLDSVGIDASGIGLLTFILLLPFVLKIFFGMLSDKVNLFGLGHRKPYIISGLLLASTGFLLAGTVQPGQDFLFFSGSIILGSFGVAFFDSSTDGYAIEIIPKKNYGKVQSIMVTGRSFGFIILSLGFGYLVQQNSYSSVFMIIGLMMIIPLVYVAFAREVPRIMTGSQFDRKAFHLLLKPVFQVFALYTLLYSIASFGVDGLITYYMSHSLHASELSIGYYGALRGIGAAIGALIVAVTYSRIGLKRMAVLTVFILSGAALLMGVSSGVPMILRFALIWGMAWGLQECVFLSLAMDISDVRIAASMFAILMAVSNAGTAIVEGVATTLTVQVGFRQVFIFLAGFNFLNLLILRILFRIWKPEI